MPDKLNEFINEAATQSVNAESPVKCPYCKRMFNSWGAWYKGHMPKCRRAWMKRRDMERKKAHRPPLSDAERAALRAKDVFKGLEEGE